MPKNIHTAVAPCGTVLKRTSDSRRYSHCLAGKPSFDTAMTHANETFTHEAENFKYYKRLVDGVIPIPLFVKDPVNFLADKRTLMRGCSTPEEYEALKLHERIEDVKKRRDRGVYDVYIALSWSSRLDLAEKAKRSYSNRTWYADVIILPTTVVVK